MSEHGSGKWPAKVVNAATVVLGVAVVGRIAYELLTPLVPILVSLFVLSLVYGAILGQWRR